MLAERRQALRWERPAADLRPEVHTLVLWQPETLRDREWKAIEAWLRRGGRLVVAGRLPALGGSLADPAGGAAEHSATPAVAHPATVGVGRVEVGGTAFDRRPAGALTLLQYPGGEAALIAFAGGRGQVLWSADPSWLTNSRVAAADNLALALALLTPPPGQKVAFDEFIHGFGVPQHWWQLLRGPLLLFILELALALTVLYWAYGTRFGRPRPLPATPPRAAVEYVFSMSSLYRRARARSVVRRLLYRSLHRTLVRLTAGAAGLSHAELAARTAARLKETPDRLQALLDQLDRQAPERMHDPDLIAAARAVAAMQRSARHVRDVS